jgi:hypothetical protein
MLCGWVSFLWFMSLEGRNAKPEEERNPDAYR